MADATPHPYYLTNRHEICAELEARMSSRRAEFEARLPLVPFETILKAAIEELGRVLPIVPYAGGDDGRMTPFFKLGAGVIALGRAARDLGAAPNVIGALMRAVFLSTFYELREEERHALGRLWMSTENQSYLRKEAQRSQRRGNPGDFVYRFIEGSDVGPEGRPFEFGLDYLECGFCKMCRTGGDEDLLPHICAMDKESYGIRGVEFQRSTTLAAGDDRCDFRFALSPAARRRDEDDGKA